MIRMIDADRLKAYWQPDHNRTFTADYFIHTIDAQPTVTQWIPCSEKMPPVGKTVLVTVKTDNDTWTDCDTWYQGDWMAYMGKDREVIAWCELPEPYTEDD